MRVRGIAVEAHWSIFIPLMITAGALAQTGYLGRYPEWSSTTTIVMALLSASLVPAFVLLHEFGHSFQARREGVRADKITLWGLGGVAWIGSPRSPGSDFRVTAAGPLVTALLAVLLGAIGWLEGRLGWPDPVVGVTVLAAQFNALMFAFNLLPAFPLDGGRILYSALWRLKGPGFALTWVFRVAIVVACSVFAFGLVLPFVNIPVSYASINISLSAIFDGAVILGLTLSAKYAVQRSAGTPRKVVVGDMVDPLSPRPALSPEATITEFLEATADAQGWRTAASPVVDAGRVLGVLSPRIADHVPVDERATMAIADVMVREAEAAPLSYNTPVDEAFRTLQEVSKQGIVREGRRVTAIILAADLADMMLQLTDRHRAAARAGTSGSGAGR